MLYPGLVCAGSRMSRGKPEQNACHACRAGINQHTGEPEADRGAVEFLFSLTRAFVV